MSFQKNIHIHFDECDPAGIAFFANHFKLAHRAIEDFVVDLGISWAEWFQSKAFAVPLIHADADYKNPLFQGNTYKVNVRISSIGETSVNVETCFETLDGQLCSTVRTTHVFIDISSHKKMPIPEKILKKLKAVL